jgi:RNA polymerase sigma-70 factor (ECF subfamily)
MNPEGYASLVRTTRWSIVRRAAGADDPAAMQALAALCAAYWYPIYAYYRRFGKDRHDAEDLTQGFFARLLEKGTFAAADPGKGRLRTFLLTDARNFMNDEHGRAVARKRGGGILHVVAGAQAEERYAREAVDDLSPDRLFQRRWALTIVEHSLRELRREFEASGKAQVFAALRPFLGFCSDPERSYDEIAVTLGVPAGTLKSQVFRLRERWRELLFEQVAETLDRPTEEEIKGELMELLGCV